MTHIIIIYVHIESWNDIGHLNVDNIDNDALLTAITKLKNTVGALSENVCLKSEHCRAGVIE